MNKKMILIAVAAVVVLAGGGGAAYFFFSGDSAEAAVEAKPSVGLIEMDTFLTNINDPRGKHHARLELKVAIAPQTVAEEIEADPVRMARMRDHVLTLLTAKTFEELSQSEGKETFRKQIAERLAPLVENGKVEEVLFADFVVQ